MGTLYEHKNEQLRELRKTYYGVLEILRHFIVNDKYTENHSYRVSVYATRIASYLTLSAEVDRGHPRGGAAPRHREAAGREGAPVTRPLA